MEGRKEESDLASGCAIIKILDAPRCKSAVQITDRFELGLEGSEKVPECSRQIFAGSLETSGPFQFESINPEITPCTCITLIAQRSTYHIPFDHPPKFPSTAITWASHVHLNFLFNCNHLVLQGRRAVSTTNERN